ncbi:MAG: O-antigen ligase family protein [Acidobacteriales bacterium]|nr:O-antigen ligase family protein [Terriglobales bacterium]
MLFFVYAAFAAFWAPEGVASVVKVFDLCGLTALILCVAGWTSRDGNLSFQTAFWLTFCSIIVLFILLTASGYGFTDSRRTTVLGGGPNAFGRNMAIGFFGSIWLVHRKCGKVWLAVTALTPMLVLMSGSRGALLSLLCAAFVYFGTERMTVLKRFVLFLSLGCVCGGVLFYSSLGQRAMVIFQERVLRQTLELRYASGRTDLGQVAYEMGMDHPLLGAGLASFPVYANAPYAHNIVLETFSETGTVGVVLLCLPFSAFAGFLLKRWRLVDRATFCAFTAALLHAQFSGDLFDSRYVFTFLVAASSVFVGGRNLMPRAVKRVSGNGGLQVRS